MTAIAIPRFSFWNPTFLFFIAVVTLRVASSPTATISFVLLAIYALTGRRQAIHALVLSWLFLMLNPAIAPNPSATSLLRYMVLFSAAASVAIRSDFFKRRARIKKVTAMTCLVGLYIIVHSLLFSPEPVISVLKGTSWFVAMITSLAAWGGMDPQERKRIAQEIFVILAAIAIACLPLLSTGYGYMPRTSLFRGVLGHSQALGPTLALLSAWSIALYMQSTRSLLVLLFALALMLVFLTGARTALVATLLGVVGASFLTSWLGRRPLLHVLPALKKASPLILTVIGLFISIIFIDGIGVRIDEFFNKGRQYASILDAYDDSRGGLIEKMLQNITTYPMTGIGFGIASDPESMVVERVGGIPISAIVEKGVTPVAVLEELGIPGAILAALWLWSLIRSSARAGLAPLSVFLTIIALNMGEATLFSPGGMGLLSIVLIGWCVSSSLNREQRVQPT